MAGTVITFGEIMLRLAPEGYQRFVQADSFRATYGGGEANVSVALSQYGVDARFVTKVPKHEIGQCAVNALRRYGVNTDCIVRGGDRLGIYFLENGASQRPSKVVYDRVGSAFSTVTADDFDWKKIFSGARWFHFTGITPALGGALPEICLDACTAARALGVTVSCDLNYRSKLWSKSAAKETMEKLCAYVDVCIANEADAADVFGIAAERTDVTAGTIHRDSYRQVAQALSERFNFSQVAVTLRESVSANDNGWSALLYDGDDFYFSRKYDIRVVDRVGGGDSFAAGLIYACLNEYAPQQAVDFAVAASCLKHSIEGDFNLVSLDEVQLLAKGNASGRVQR